MLHDVPVPLVAGIAEGDHVSFALQHRAECEEDECRARHGETEAPVPPTQTVGDAEQVVAEGAELLVELHRRLVHVLQAVGGDRRLPVRGVDALVQGLALRFQRGSGPGQGARCLGRLAGRFWLALERVDTGSGSPNRREDLRDGVVVRSGPAFRNVSKAQPLLGEKPTPPTCVLPKPNTSYGSTTFRHFLLRPPPCMG